MLLSASSLKQFTKYYYSTILIPNLFHAITPHKENKILTKLRKKDRKGKKRALVLFTACMNLIQIWLPVKEICFFSHSASIYINDYQLGQQSKIII